jgi:hypothetical protein
MVNQMHMLAAQEQRARDVELHVYVTLETWHSGQPASLAHAERDGPDNAQELCRELDR